MISFVLKQDKLRIRARNILGVDENSTADEIKRAYRSKVIQHHPDRNPDDPKAHQATALINESYDLLRGKIDKPSLLENDSLAELVAETPVMSLEGVPNYDEWLIQQGFYDFVKPD
ncbi:J domain-containing protein [Candidatus Woesearchaeota archaeon]|nr:J domain-containing protein [Candidatus Woesearchaeota archaeon]